MRSLSLLLLCVSSWTLAESQVRVDTHGLMRLPSHLDQLVLERLDVADHATLLVPAEIREIRVAELVLGREARIEIAPSEQAFRLEVERAEIASGAQLSARGAAGTFEKPAMPGRTLTIRLQTVTAQELQIDVRGGRGTPGYPGLDGADGESGGCTWGRASKGYDGQDGGDGQAGAAGGQVRIEVPLSFAVETLKGRVDGGSGGAAGAGGKPGRGGVVKGCWLYSTDGASDGRPGQAGRPGPQGAAGSLDVVRF
jgi:hypothetical protein